MGWSVVTSEYGVNRIVKSDGSDVISKELKIGTEKLIEYYYIEQWDGVLPKTYVDEKDVSTIMRRQRRQRGHSVISSRISQKTQNGK